VLVIHGETLDLFGTDRTLVEPGGAMLSPAELSGPWSYIALGHYHVQHQVAERCWYSGALEYCSPNPWGELRAERDKSLRGKGWLLADLENGMAARRAIEAPRRVLDLPWLDANDLAAPELDRLLADAIDGVVGGIGGAVVRQVVRNVPRLVARALDHARIRTWKAEALHLQLDLRRPDPVGRQSVSGAPGKPESLPDTLRGYLRERALPPGIESARFVERGMGLLAAVDDHPAVVG
jgi:hypothetical protein